MLQLSGPDVNFEVSKIIFVIQMVPEFYSS